MDETAVRTILAPHISEITELVSLARHIQTLELEARLVMQGGQRTPNIPREDFKKIYTFFNENQRVFNRVIPWTISTAYYFKTPNLRYVISDTKEGKQHEWMIKTPLVQREYNILNRPFGVRINLKDEKPTTASKEPMIYTRIRKRESYILGPFSFDFTIVWAGKTLEQARVSKIAYEIEVEFLGSSKSDLDLDKEERQSNQVLAQFFLYRILELQGLGTPTNLVRCR